MIIINLTTDKITHHFTKPIILYTRFFEIIQPYNSFLKIGRVDAPLTSFDSTFHKTVAMAMKYKMVECTIL